MAARFRFYVPDGAFRDYPRLALIVTYMIEEYCEWGEMGVFQSDPDSVRIEGEIKPTRRKDLFRFIQFFNELGYNVPTFVNVSSPQEYEERRSSHAMSVAVRLVPEVAHLLSGEQGTVPHIEPEPERPDEPGSDHPL